MKGRNAFIVLLISIFLIIIISAQTVEAYRPIIDLGSLSGKGSNAWGMSQNGQIVGSSDKNSSYWGACRFDATGSGANVNLGNLGGQNNMSSALSVNDRGQIVGWADNVSRSLHACLFDSTGGKANIDLGTLGGESSTAYSINNAGRIVGWSINNIQEDHACIFDSTGGGNNIDLGGGSAYFINNNGQIIGQGVDIYACLFDETGGFANTSLGTIPGFETSCALSINNIGQIAGYATQYDLSFSPIATHAVLFDPTGRGNNIDMGVFKNYLENYACSINDLGHVVGWSGDIHYSRAVLFDPTGRGNNIDLNTFIDPLSGWTLISANCINNNDWIVGQGIYNGEYRAFLLTPEPATILLFALGGFALRRRK